ncbi:MAG: hypothetical protein H0U74_06740 [Bradymonadaceae bacterium]|nr:hypothetical protein [Lujinxingiaceae bacterium]
MKCYHQNVLTAAILVVVGLLTGCATSLTNMSQARVLEAGDAQATMGYQLDLHSQSFSSLIEVGKAAYEHIDEGEGEITEETFRRGLDTILLYKLFPLGGSPEVIGRVGIYDDLLHGVDVGIRYNGTVIKGDVRVQLWESADRALALTAQLGYGHHRSVAPGAVEWLTLTKWNRKDFDLGLSMGWELPDIFKAYVVPRLVISRISTEPKLSSKILDRLPEGLLDFAEFFPATNMYYMGANTGFMVGYKYVFVNFDLSLFRINFEPLVLGSRRDYGGWGVSPTLGLTGHWY